MTLWLRGWFFWFRAIYMVRTKKHGKGAMPWPMALAMARNVRFIVYGQHRMVWRPSWHAILLGAACWAAIIAAAYLIINMSSCAGL